MKRLKNSIFKKNPQISISICPKRTNRKKLLMEFNLQYKCPNNYRLICLFVCHTQCHGKLPPGGMTQAPVGSPGSLFSPQHYWPSPPPLYSPPVSAAASGSPAPHRPPSLSRCYPYPGAPPQH